MKWLFAAVFLAMAAGVWFFINPLRGFGVCGRGLTTYEMVPFPWVDFQVRAGGEVRRVPKSHRLLLDDVVWLTENKPETLVVSTGWDGAVDVSPQIVDFLHGYDVRVLKTGDAVALYNNLLAEGRRVAIHLHSTD
jgi:hypothetical protein